MSSPNLTNLSFLQAFTKGDKVKMDKYIEMYIKNTSAVFNEIYSDLDVNDFEGVKLKAHSIKPQAQYMGVEILKEVLIKIEQSVQNGTGQKELKPLIDQAMEINDRAVLELKQFLETDQ